MDNLFPVIENMVNSTRSTSAMGHALTPFFTVTVGSINLGDWDSCSGVGVEADWKVIENPGDYTRKRYMFADISFQGVKLTRGIDSNPATVQTVQNWVASKLAFYAQPGYNPIDILWPGESASISLYNSRQEEVKTWVLDGVLPKSYKGPDLSAANAKVATETLELYHEGFLPLELLLGKFL